MHDIRTVELLESPMESKELSSKDRIFLIILIDF